MAKSLVTGGAGFIGSHLAERLLREKCEVVVLDDLSTGRLDNITPLLSRANFTFVRGNAADHRLVHQLVGRTDYVYHLAASVGVKLVVGKMVESIANNIKSTEEVLEAASRFKKRVLLTSTSEVYGRGAKEIFSEKDDLAMGPTTKGRWSYACSKALDEYMAFAYARERGLQVTVARLFNTVGERQSSRYGMVLPTFVHQALKGEPLTIHGDGRQTRCFCHVSDVTGVLARLVKEEASVGEVYNVGGTDSVTMEELADRVIALTGSRSRKVFVPYERAYRQGFEDVNRRVPDISKLKELIGFEPKLSLDDIILRMREYVTEYADSAKQG